MKAAKRKTRLLARIKDYEMMVASRNGSSHQCARMSAGGYRRPGSTKKER